VIKKPKQYCYNVAANLDGYLPWCQKGGMKDIQVTFSSYRGALGVRQHISGQHVATPARVTHL
jgi:hypothetical protein